MFDEIIDKFIVSSPYALRYTKRIFLLGFDDWCDRIEQKIRPEVDKKTIIDRGHKIKQDNRNTYEIILSDFSNSIDILDALKHTAYNGAVCVLVNNKNLNDLYDEIFKETGYPNCICMIPHEDFSWIIYDKFRGYTNTTRLEWL